MMNRAEVCRRGAGFVLLVLMTLLVSMAAAAGRPGPIGSDGLAALAPVSPRMQCAALIRVDISGPVGAATSITQAVEHTTASGADCIVEGRIAPHILFRVRLPEQGWTQRYLQTGCGGLCGMLSLDAPQAEQCMPYHDGHMVVASTDMGHEGSMGDGSFGNDPQERIDFAYRSVHLTALAAKALIRRFYGQRPRYSYFSGCSDGGREALMEAERYPDDFDGIAAGAPAMNFQVQNTFYHTWMARANTNAEGQAILTAAKLPLLHRAALAACDASDGVKDGMISNPRLCHFDPAVIECAPGTGDTSQCLTSAQVETVRKFYAGPHDAAGHRFVVGSVQVGSELNWAGVFVPFKKNGQMLSTAIADQTIRYLAYAKNPPASATVKNFRFDMATFDRLRPMHALYDATNPDIKAFVGHGGKLILWHGWADPHISPLNTIAYYQAVQKELGADTEASVRLFLFPGMGHCGGGDGLNTFDILTPLMRWVESHHAPQEILAHRVVGQPVPMPPPGAGHGAAPPAPPMLLPQGKLPPLTRAVYPYPLMARYVGHGSVYAASSFKAGPPPRTDPPVPSWVGSDFYRPDFQKPFAVVDGQLVAK